MSIVVDDVLQSPGHNKALQSSDSWLS